MFAGPNGAGKSTAYTRSTIEESGKAVWVINPDLLSAQIARTERLEPRQANLEAVQRIEQWLDSSIRAYQTIGVETVLSTDKYRRIVTEAKARGFVLKLAYVILRTPDLHIARVRRRVREGGHDVPADRIVERWHRSLKQLPWFLDQADIATIWDNSGATPQLMLDKRDGQIRLDPSAMPEIRAAVRDLPV